MSAVSSVAISFSSFDVVYVVWCSLFRRATSSTLGRGDCVMACMMGYGTVLPSDYRNRAGSQAVCVLALLLPRSPSKC